MASKEENEVPWFVQVDTREQKPWTFDRRFKGCQGSESTTLKTGDYSLRGYNEQITVERKGSMAEWSQCLFADRFVRELERMREFAHSYVILEFTLDNLLEFPQNSGIPPFKWKYLKLRPNILLKRHIELELAFPKTKFHFAGQGGRLFTVSLFRRFLESLPPPETPTHSPAR